MMKNYAKCLIVLGIAGLFTIINQGSAFFTQAPSYICNGYPDCTINLQAYWRFDFYNSTSNSSTNDLYYLKTSCTANNTCSSNGSSSLRTYGASGNSGDFQIVSHNPGEYIQYRTKTNNSAEGVYNTFTYNFIKLAADGEGYNYYWWSEQDKSYNYKWILLNGYVNNALPDERFIYYEPRHASFVFYNQDYLSGLHTIQFIGNYELVDKFVYVDPIANGDNVFFVDTNKMLAYSKYVDDKYLLSQLLFGNYVLDDNFFNNFGWDKWYDIQFGGNYFFPQTYGNFSYPSNQDPISLFSNGGGRKSHPYKNIGLIYNKRLDGVVPPNYGGGSDNGSGNTVNQDEINTYESCINDLGIIKNIAANEYACRNTIDPDCTCEWGNCSCFSNSDFTNMYNFLHNYEGTGFHSGNMGGVSCSQWYNKTVSLYYGEWSGNYLRNFLTANSWSVDPNGIDLADYCGTYPRENQQSWACNYLGIGCDDYSLGAVMDRIRFQLKPFLDETVGEYQRAFMSGYNYLGEGNKCNSDMYGKSYSWGNFLVLFVLAWLSFTIYSVFKD